MVSVEEPCSLRPERKLASAAPGMRQGLMPRCFQNSASSTATTALRSTGGMSRKPITTTLLDRELAQHAAVGREDLGDDVGLEVLERRDLRQVVLVREEDAEQRSAEDREGEQEGEPRSGAG